MTMLYLGNLPTDISEPDVLGLVSQYAKVYWLKLGADRISGRFRGFAFAEVDDALSETVIRQLHGREICGRAVRVVKTKPCRRT